LESAKNPQRFRQNQNAPGSETNGFIDGMAPSAPAGCLRIARLCPASGSRSLREQVAGAGTGRKSTSGFKYDVDSQFRHPLESDTSGNGQRACACREHSGDSVEFANAGIRNPTIPVMGPTLGAGKPARRLRLPNPAGLLKNMTET